MSRNLGQAGISIVPGNTPADFKAKAEAMVKKGTQGVQGTVKLNADDQQVYDQLKKIRAEMEQKLPELKFDGDISRLEANMAKIDAQLAEFDAKTHTAKIDASGPAGAKIDEIMTKLKAMDHETATAKLDADDKSGIAKVAEFRAAIAKLMSTVPYLVFDVDILQADAKVTKLDAMMEKFRGTKVTAEADVDVGKGTAELEKESIELDKFGAKHVTATADVNTDKAKFSLKDLTGFISGVFAKEAGDAAKKAGDDTSKGFFASFATGVNKYGNQQVGIAAGVVAGLAALPAAVGAVGTVAGIALGGALVAGAESLVNSQIKTLTTDIAKQAKAGNIEMVEAEQQQIDQLQKELSAFKSVNVAVANVKDSFTQFAVVVSKPLIQPFANALNDLSVQLNGPLRGSFTSLFKAVAPLVAPVEKSILSLATGALPGLTSMLTKARQPLSDLFTGFGRIVGLKVGEWFNTATPYIQQSSQYLLKLVSALGSTVTWLIKFGGETAKAFSGGELNGFGGSIKEIANDITQLIVPAFQGWMGVMAPIAHVLLDIVGPIAQFAAANPRLVQSIAAVTAAMLALNKASSLITGAGAAMTGFGSKVEGAAAKAEGSLGSMASKGGAAVGKLGSAMGSLGAFLGGPWAIAIGVAASVALPPLISALVKATTAVGPLTKQANALNDAIDHTATSSESTATKLNQFSQAVNKGLAGLGASTNALKAAQGDWDNHKFSQALQEAADAPGAFQKFSAAVLKSATDYSKLIQQVNAGQPGIEHGAAAFTTMAGTASQAAQNTEEVRQAWTAFIGILTGGDTAVASLAQAVKTYGTAAKSATTPTAELHGDFAAVVTQASATITSFQQMGVAAQHVAGSSKDVHKANLDVIASLVPLAGHSKEYQAELVALAQQAGLNVHTYADVTKALKDQGASSKDLSNDSSKLTQDVAKVTQAQKDLANATHGAESQLASQAILAAGGAPRAFTKYAQALAEAHGKTTELAQSTAQTLYNSLVHAGTGSTDAKNQIMAMAKQMGLTDAQAHQLANGLVVQKSAADKAAASSSALKNILTTTGAAMGLTTGDTSRLTAAIKTNQGNIDTNRAAFEAFTHSMGLSKAQADSLFDSLSKVRGDYAASVTVKVSGGGTVSASVAVSQGNYAPGASATNPPANKQAQSQQTANSLTRLPSNNYMGGKISEFAKGGKLPGWHNTGDNMMGVSSAGAPVAQLQGGEAVVPKNLATHPEFTDFAKRRGIPGFASGGFIKSPSVSSSLSAIAEPGYAQSVGNQVAKAVESATSSSVKSAQQAAANAALGPAAYGSTTANGTTIFNYLMSNLFSGSKIGAAGALAAMYGESGWNPESHEPNGPDGAYNGGLMGFTPLYNYLGHISSSRSNVPDSVVTGNGASDMAHQLKAIVEYVKAFGMMGVVARMKGAGSVFEAANMWGTGVEHFGINDVHSTGIELASRIAGQANATPTVQGKAADGKIATSKITGEQTFSGYSYAKGGLVDIFGASNAHRLAPYIKHKNRNSGVEGELATRTGTRFPKAIAGTDAALVWEGYNDIAGGASAGAVAAANSAKIKAAHTQGIPVVLGSLQQGTIGKDRLQQISDYNRWAATAGDAYAAIGTDIPKGNVHGNSLEYNTIASKVDSKFDTVLAAKTRGTLASSKAEQAAMAKATAAKAAAEKSADDARILKLGDSHSRSWLETEATHYLAKANSQFKKGDYKGYTSTIGAYNDVEAAMSRYPSQLNAQHDKFAGWYKTDMANANRYKNAGDLKDYAIWNQKALANAGKIKTIDAQLANPQAAPVNPKDLTPIQKLTNVLGTSDAKEWSAIAYQLKNHSLDPAATGKLTKSDMASLALNVTPSVLDVLYGGPGSKGANAPALATALKNDLFNQSGIYNAGSGKALSLLGKATGVHGQYAGKKFSQGGWVNEHVKGVGMQSGLPYDFGERGPEKITPATVQDGGDSETKSLLRAILAEQRNNNAYAAATAQNTGSIDKGVGGGFSL